jgi:uncharacterized protein
VDRLFLDANVLFSAAYNPTSPLVRFWELSEVVLISSAYAVQEARQNLAFHRPNHLGELEHLVRKLDLVDAPPNTAAVAGAVGLPDKDLPILLAAIEAKATHLLTVDKKHFGFLYGETVDGVLITTPGDYLRGRSE